VSGLSRVDGVNVLYSSPSCDVMVSKLAKGSSRNAGAASMTTSALVDEGKQTGRDVI